MTESFSLGRISPPRSDGFRLRVPLRPAPTSERVPPGTELLSAQQASFVAVSSNVRGLASDSMTAPPPGQDALEGQLFDARGSAKQIAAGLSMHLSGEWRGSIYRQIDSLLDAAEWQIGDGLLDQDSMRTFLRFVIFADVTAVPSLGMTNAGNLLAAWRQGTRRLTMEFQAGDRCHLLISHVLGDDPSIVSFTGRVKEARGFLDRETFPFR
jgi:hypothetical protein